MRAPYSSSSSASSMANKATPCCSKVEIKRGPWTPEEDELLSNYVNKEGEGRWRTLPKRAGLQRCGKSCCLRWVNYLRPNVKRGQIDPDEEDLILRLHRLLGNRWSLIAGRIPGRTDNEIKNYWNTHLSKKLINQGIDPRNHKPLNPIPPNNDHNFVPPNNTFAPILSSSNPPVPYQNRAPVIVQETTGLLFNPQQASTANIHVGDQLVLNGQNEFPFVNQPCNDHDLQNIDRLMVTNNSNNVYESYVTESSCNYYQDSFALFLDALINEPYNGSTSYHRPNVAAAPPLLAPTVNNYGQGVTSWEAQLGSAYSENAGDLQHLNDILRRHE